MEYVELGNVRLVHQTDMAGLFELEEGDQIWIPWSCIEDNEEDLKVGYEGSVYVSEWFAERENLV